MRTDATGHSLMDWHTVRIGDGAPAKRARTRGKSLAVGATPLMTRREYRTDALHTVALWERDGGHYRLEALAEALRRPRWVLYLGRKSCPLALPVNAEILEADTLKAAFALRPALPPQLTRTYPLGLTSALTSRATTMRQGSTLYRQRPASTYAMAASGATASSTSWRPSNALPDPRPPELRHQSGGVVTALAPSRRRAARRHHLVWSLMSDGPAASETSCIRRATTAHFTCRARVSPRHRPSGQARRWRCPTTSRRSLAFHSTLLTGCASQAPRRAHHQTRPDPRGAGGFVPDERRRSGTML